MLNRAGLLRLLRHPLLDMNRCWLTAGGALVLYGLRQETRDIDLGCEPSLADELECAGWAAARRDDGSRKLCFPPCIDVFENWGRGSVQRIEGVSVVSLEDILLLKRQLNRPKDQPDIAAIQRALGR